MGNIYFVSAGLNKEFYDYLATKNIEFHLIKKETSVYDAIAAHPDIFIFSTDEKLIVAPGKYDQFNRLFEKQVIKGQNSLGSKYPQTVHYNAAFLGNYVIHNFQYTDQKIKQFIEQNNLTKINVNQGYTKCNVAIIDENSIITSDRGIYTEVTKHNIDALLIESGHIKLRQMDYGFIGGCCGMIENELIFYGNISKHPDFEKIDAFVNRKNIKMKWFDFPLEDIGSILKLKIK